MNIKDKNNLITSITIALVPVGPLSFLLPAGAVVTGFLVVAALAGLAYMECRQTSGTYLSKR